MLFRTCGFLSLVPFLASSVACSSDSTPEAFSSTNSLADASSSSTDGSPPGNFEPPTSDLDAAVAIPCVPNASNAEVPANGCDDDANGQTDEPITCDDSLAANGDAFTFAKALGLCKKSEGGSWGVVSAEYSTGGAAAAAPEQHNITTKFGSVLKPREGKLLGVIGTTITDESGGSSGFRVGSLAGPSGTIPSTCAVGASGCTPSATTANNVMNVKLSIKVPANAKGFGLDFNFFSSEWPMYVGSINDGFVIHVTSEKGSGNIAFDAKGGVVNVNNGFFDRCTPGVKVGCLGVLQAAKSVCAGGESELAGTGFARFTTPYVSADNVSSATGKPCYGQPELPASGGGSTGWLSSQTAVTPGETITVQIAIWNALDHLYQSVALVDHFRWIPTETTTVTTRPEIVN